MYLSPGEPLQLPQVLACREDERTYGQFTGLAQAALEKPQLVDLRARLLVERRRFEAALLEHQYTLGSQRELHVQAQVAQHVRDDGTVESFLEGLQVAPRVRIGKRTGVHRFEQLDVGVEVGLEPFTQRFLALLE